MVFKTMIIQKHIEKKVEVPYIFVEGKLDIDSDYFIKKIDQGIEAKDNKSFKTNIKGAMTDWNFFNEDEKFRLIAYQIGDYLDSNVRMPPYDLKNAWGYRLGHREFTLTHKHSPAIVSTALYLNDHEQTLKFPEIKKEIKPEKGKFVLFSGFLHHGCKRSNTQNYKYGISFNFSPPELF